LSSLNRLRRHPPPTHHPAFLPKNYFRKMEVEGGGVGEGTVFHAEMEVFGSKFAFRMRVSEPQPGA
jgi:hypothetical protein